MTGLGWLLIVGLAVGWLHNVAGCPLPRVRYGTEGIRKLESWSKGGRSKRPSSSCVVCLVHLVSLVCLVCLVCLVGRIGKLTRGTKETGQTGQTSPVSRLSRS